MRAATQPYVAGQEMSSRNQLLPFTVLQAFCFTTRSRYGRLNSTGKKSLGWQKWQDNFAALFSDYVYDGKVVIILKKTGTKGRKQIGQIRNAFMNSLSYVSEKGWNSFTNTWNTECWMVKPETFTAAWDLVIPWAQCSRTTGQTWLDKHLLKELCHLFWPHSTSTRK